MYSPRKVIVNLVVATLFGLMLYLPFRSNQWDLNGVAEAEAVESGGKDLFPPNHMLYRPVGFVVFKALQSWGYGGNSATILQYVTATLAALGVGFAFSAFYYLTNHTLVSVMATVLLATSWSYWTFSTDAYYITPAAMAVSAALALLLRTEQSNRSASVIGLVCALSILFWQASVFIVPSFIVALLWTQRSKHPQARLAMIGAFLGVLALAVGLSYMLVGTLVYGYRNVFDLISWSLGHSSDTGGRPALWGRWAVDRVPSAAISAVSSFIPIWDGLGLRRLLQGIIQPDKILAQLSLAALLLLIAASFARFISQRLRRACQAKYVVWFILAYALFLPFIIWWDPFESKWLVIPNIFLIAAIAKIWGGRSNPKSGICTLVYWMYSNNFNCEFYFDNMVTSFLPEPTNADSRVLCQIY